MTGESRLSEQFSQISKVDLQDALKSQEFTVPQETSISLKEAASLLKNKYPEFNFDNLDDNLVLHSAAKVEILQKLSQQVIKLSNLKEFEESLILKRKVELVGNPKISRTKTALPNILRAFHGNLEMTASILGIGRENGVGWLDFIIRTWGKRPQDFR